MKTSKNIGMLMIAVAIIGTSGTFALVDGSLDSQSIDTTVDTQGLFGHVEATVYDEDGNIKAYTQSDNKIVNNGLDMIMKNTFSPAGGHTGGISTALGQVTHMQLGIGTAEVAAGINIITVASVSGTCTADTFTSSAAGGGAAITLTGTFTIAGDGTGGCGDVLGEAGLFDGSTGSGIDDMFAQNAFASTVDLAGTDSLVVNWTFTFTDN